jgi:hypothetical protein
MFLLMLTSASQSHLSLNNLPHNNLAHHHLPHPSTFAPPYSRQALGLAPIFASPLQQQALVQALAIQQLHRQLLAQQGQATDSFSPATAGSKLAGSQQTLKQQKVNSAKPKPQAQQLKHFLANSLKVLAFLTLLTLLTGSGRRVLTKLHPQHSLKAQELEDFKLLNHYLDAKILHHLPKPLASGLAAFLSPFKGLLQHA